jgi:hypothetical protein
MIEYFWQLIACAYPVANCLKLTAIVVGGWLLFI